MRNGHVQAVHVRVDGALIGVIVRSAERITSCLDNLFHERVATAESVFRAVVKRVSLTGVTRLCTHDHAAFELERAVFRCVIIFACGVFEECDVVFLVKVLAVVVAIFVDAVVAVEVGVIEDVVFALLTSKNVFLSAELDLGRLAFFTVETLDVESEIEHGNVTLLVEEQHAQRDVVRIEILFEIDLEIGQIVRYARVVGHQFLDDNLQEARSDVESDRVGEHVDEQAQRIGILSVLVLAERIRRRHCVCVVLIAVCHKTADETAYHFFDGVRAHINVEFRLFAEQGFDVKIQACFARLFVVVVVDAEKVRFAAVKELAGVVVIVTIFSCDVAAAFEFVVLLAPNIDCNVKVTHVDCKLRQDVEFEAEIESEREVDVERCVFRDLELALHATEQSAEHFAESLVDAVVLFAEHAVCPHVQAAVCLQRSNLCRVCHLHVVAVILLVGDVGKHGVCQVSGRMQGIVDLLVVIVREVDLACVDKQVAAQRERHVIHIVRVHVLFERIVLVFGLVEVGLQNGAFLLHLDPVVFGIFVLVDLRVGFFFAHTARNECGALRCEPFVRDEHFLLSVVHFFLVHVHSLDAFIRRAGVDKVFFALDHSADVVREGLAVLGGKLELAVVLHKQGAVVNDVILVLVFVISRICKVFVCIEFRAVVKRPVVDTVAFLVHAAVKGFVRIDVARALCDADDVIIACFRAFCVLELGHAHLRSKDVERDLVIP